MAAPAEVVTLSTHVLDAAAGGGRPGLRVTVHDAHDGEVGHGTTDENGRITHLATGLSPGHYRISWLTGGGFLSLVSVTVEVGEDRHYHLPLLITDVSAVTYLGA